MCWRAPRRGRATPAASAAASFFRRDRRPSLRHARPEASRHAGQSRPARPPAAAAAAATAMPSRIRELQGMMAARGCDLPGGGLAGGGAGPGTAVRADDQCYFGDGTFRTLCVRTCDGYYFPISFSTTSDQFREDAHTCAGDVPRRGGAALLLRQSGRRPGEHDVARRRALFVAADRLPVPHQPRRRLHLPAGRRLFDRRPATAAPAAEIATGRAAAAAAAGARRRPGDARQPRRRFRAARSAASPTAPAATAAGRVIGPPTGRPIAASSAPVLLGATTRKQDGVGR